MTDANTTVKRLERMANAEDWIDPEIIPEALALIKKQNAVIVDNIAAIDEAQELIRSQQEEIAVLRETALEEAATLAETFWELRDWDWWLKSTKKEISASMCHSIAAAIRARAAGRREG